MKNEVVVCLLTASGLKDGRGVNGEGPAHEVVYRDGPDPLTSKSPKREEIQRRNDWSLSTRRSGLFVNGWLWH